MCKQFSIWQQHGTGHRHVVATSITRRLMYQMAKLAYGAVGATALQRRPSAHWGVCSAPLSARRSSGKDLTAFHRVGGGG